MGEKTDEVFIEEDGERWFHTGDVGEYIAPERLETIYCQSKYLSNIFVYGDSNKSNVVAVAIPDVIAAKKWADKNGVKYSNDTQEPNVPKEICENEEFNKVITEDLKSIAEGAKLNRYEQVPAVHIDGMYWTPDTGMVTDAMKNKRDPLYSHYEEE